MESKSFRIAIPGTHNFLGGDDVFVIAEIGKNFIQTKDERPVEEYIRNAKKLIDAAADAGVDAVKFQTHEVSDEQALLDVTSPHFKGSDRYAWVSRNTRITPISFWREIKEHAKNRGVLFFSTPMSKKAAEKLSAVGVPMWKIGSGDVTDLVLLDYVAETGKPVIISTGMVSLEELDGIIRWFQSKKVPLAVLYCVSQYPAPKEAFNLATIEYLQEKYPDVVVGFSDHSVDSPEIPLAAVKSGARVIEKHFSLSRDLWGSDHKASLTPEEMKELVEKIRSRSFEKVDVTPYYGDKKRELEGASNEFRPYFQKSLVAAIDIPKGTVITKEMLVALRPIFLLKGLPAAKLYDIIGKTAAREIKEGEVITEDSI